MKTVSCWGHLKSYGIDALTGESCALGYRLLCDITENGKRVIEKCLSCELRPSENWNSGAVGSIMLTPEMLMPLAVFALLEAGCREVYAVEGTVVGVEADDTAEAVARFRSLYGNRISRRFAYCGPFQDRNQHQMSGRVQ